MAITTSSFEKEYIRDEAQRIKARRILEVGAFKGQTTAVLSRVAAQNGGSVIAIDPMRWASKPAHFFEWIDGLLHPFSYESTFWKNVRKTGHDNVTLIRALSTDAELIARPDPRLAEFDLVFIDGEHTYEGVLADIKNWGSRVRPGGLILMHDIIARFPGVVKVFRQLESDPRYRIRWPKRGTVGVVEVSAVPTTQSASASSAE
jgi:predicted O-methyltransferase YrrM